jgi:hypothetical protein
MKFNILDKISPAFLSVFSIEDLLMIFLANVKATNPLPGADFNEGIKG